MIVRAALLSSPHRVRVALACGLVALCAAFASPPAAAQWKWRDANGVQYSDRPPPPSVAEKDIISRPPGARRPVEAAVVAAPSASAASGPGAGGTAKAADPKLEAKKREAEEKKAAEKKAEDEKLAKERTENCTRARGYLRTLEDGMRIARVNDKGEREVLDDAQRAQEVARAKDVIATDCAPRR